MKQQNGTFLTEEEVARLNEELCRNAQMGGSPQSITTLINRGANVNATDVDGRSALMLAARNGHTETVTALLDRGADVNATTNPNANGSTALRYAIVFERTRTVDAIITHALASQIDISADLNDPTVQNSRLSREIVTLLAIALPEGNSRDSFIQNFNRRNPENQLHQTEKGKISKLRELRESLIQEFSKDETALQATRLATIAIAGLLANPSQLVDLSNHLLSDRHEQMLSVPPGSASTEAGREFSQTDITKFQLLNPQLTQQQNEILLRTAADLLRPRPNIPNIDARQAEEIPSPNPTVQNQAEQATSHPSSRSGSEKSSGGKSSSGGRG